jgi:hypothetical protein
LLVTALVRYTAADFVRSARFLWPSLAFVAALLILYSTGDNPPLGSYAFTAALLYPAAAWVGLLVGGSEADIQRELTVTAAGSLARVLLAKALCGLLVVAALTVVAIAYPIVLGLLDPPATVGDVLVGVAAHLLCGLPGLALGLLCSRPSAPRQAYAWLWLLVFLVLTVPAGGLASSRVTALRWLGAAAPPVLRVSRTLMDTGGGPVGPHLLGPAAVSAAFSGAAVALLLRRARTRA